MNSTTTAQYQMRLRSIDGTAAKIILAFLINPVGMSVEDLLEWTGVKKRETLYQPLKLLGSYGWLINRSKAHGKEFWYPQNFSEILPPGLVQGSLFGNPDVRKTDIWEGEEPPEPAQLEQPAGIPGVRLTDTCEEETGQVSVLRTPEEENDPRCPQNGHLALVVSSSSLTTSNLKTPPTGLETDVRKTDTWENEPAGTIEGEPVRTDYKGLAVPDLLGSTQEILKGTIADKDLQLGTLEARVVLAWIATVLNTRNITSPAGWVYTKLLRGLKPPRKYYDDPEAYLPETYLQDLGLVTAREPEPAAVEADEEPEQTHTVTADPDPMLDARTNGGQNMSPRQAWEAVLGQLSMDMPRSSFDTWVRDTQPVRWDDGVLSIGVRNGYARDWLESRLLSTVSRLLAGMLDRAVDVRFVVEAEQ